MPLHPEKRKPFLFTLLTQTSASEEEFRSHSEFPGKKKGEKEG